MTEPASLGLAIAFSAGLLSFLSPCVLPLVPSYVTFITGLSLEDVQRSRRTAMVHALLFIFGFTLIFMALGASATVLGLIAGMTPLLVIFQIPAARHVSSVGYKRFVLAGWSRGWRSFSSWRWCR